MNKGFITIPILVIALLGITVVGGGGYAVYKVNQIQKDSDTRVSELELKIEQIAPVEPVVEVATESVATTTATSSVEDVVIEEKPVAVTPAVVRTPAVVAPTPAPAVVAPPVVQAPVDVCTNIAGLQSVVPDGYKLSSGSCVELVDRCPALAGIQEEIPAGMLLTREYGCISENEFDTYKSQIIAAEKAEKEAEQKQKECKAAESELSALEDESDKYMDKYRKNDDSDALSKAADISLDVITARSKMNAICNNYYAAPYRPSLTSCSFVGNQIYCSSY